MRKYDRGSTTMSKEELAQEHHFIQTALSVGKAQSHAVLTLSYAEQESINFTNWSCSRDCNYSMEGVDRWVYKYDVNSVITTTQLYQLYKKETQQTKTS